MQPMAGIGFHPPGMFLRNSSLIWRLGIHFDELKTLGNRYLVGISHSGPTQRYSLPNLDEIQEENEGASLLTGRLSGDSAMWDGVLRDRET